MPYEVTYVLRFEDNQQAPTKDEIENEYDCVCVELEQEDV